ncbi:hypothetical protein K7432_013622, partial [Basidiobolus ranarum]
MTQSLLRLITFDAYGTLFTPRGNVASQYSRAIGKFGIQVGESVMAKSFKQAFQQQAES